VEPGKCASAIEDKVEYLCSENVLNPTWMVLVDRLPFNSTRVEFRQEVANGLPRYFRIYNNPHH
jgi:hypothetical protein